MAASWNKGYDPKEIARRMEEVKSIDVQGHVTFKGLGPRGRCHFVYLYCRIVGTLFLKKL